MMIRELTIDRYDEVLALMERTPGVSVRDADSKEGAARYLSRNPGLSFVAEVDGKIVGCAFSGHDGRRGYVQHVIVDLPFRRRGIAQALVRRCLDGLQREGIVKAHLDVLSSNIDAQLYWQKRGWERRHDIVRYSWVPDGEKNA
jgi:N-acetylglutamate synthase